MISIKRDFFNRLPLPLRSRGFSRQFIAGSFATLLIFSSSHIASAATFTFSQFQQGSGSVNPFDFINAGAGSTFSIINEPVIFSYTVPNGYGPANTPINAKISLTSTVSAPATPGFIISQPLKDVHMIVTADVPLLGQDLLLEIFDGGLGSTATLFGFLGGQVALQASDTNVGGFEFEYASDFLSFALATERNYGLSFSSVTPGLSINDNGYLNTFETSGTGTFAANSVPEPTTSVLLAIGVAGFYLLRRRFGSSQR